MSIDRIREKMFLAGWSKGDEFTPLIDEKKRAFWYSIEDPRKLFAYASEYDQPAGCGWRGFFSQTEILQQSERLRSLGCQAVLIDSLSKTDKPLLIDDYIEVVRTALTEPPA